MVVSPRVEGARAAAPVESPRFRADCAATQAGWKAHLRRRKVARAFRAEENDLSKMVLSHTAEPQFSQPVRQIVMMLIVLGLTARWRC